MARIKGVDIPNDKRIEISLTYIYGIGSHLHEDPEVPNYGKAGTGIILKKGMTIAVEPMLNLGTAKVYLLDDDWTIVTGDNKPSAHFEHTIIVTDDGYEILTGDDKCE